MSRRLDRRLRKLEAAADRPLSFSGGDGTGTTTLIMVTGGLPGEPRHATIGGRVVPREPEETLDDFGKRCRALAVEVGERTCVVGGLPPSSWLMEAGCPATAFDDEVNEYASENDDAFG
jgi:hypothetical protein